jgi:hypothetical protein
MGSRLREAKAASPTGGPATPPARTLNTPDAFGDTAAPRDPIRPRLRPRRLVPAADDFY